MLKLCKSCNTMKNIKHNKDICKRCENDSYGERTNKIVKQFKEKENWNEDKK